MRTRAFGTGSPPVPSTRSPPTIAVVRATSDLPRVEADMDERLAVRHQRPRMDREHDAGLRRFRLARGVAVQVEIVAEHGALLDAVAAADGALEEPAARRMHPGEVREVEEFSVIGDLSRQQLQVPADVAQP